VATSPAVAALLESAKSLLATASIVAAIGLENVGDGACIISLVCLVRHDRDEDTAPALLRALPKTRLWLEPRSIDGLACLIARPIARSIVRPTSTLMPPRSARIELVAVGITRWR
jgi:hypothetical protein